MECLVNVIGMPCQVLKTFEKELKIVIETPHRDRKIPHLPYP